jgi:hypothetical protein
MASTTSDNRKIRPWTWKQQFIPSLGGVIGSVIFLLILLTGDRLLLDADTGWHIRTGDYIIENTAVPKVDFFSHRKFGEPWIAHEWLSDVVFSVSHRTAGLNGVVVLSAGIISLTFILLYRLLQFYRFNLLTVTALTVLAALTASIHWLARPHLFSICLSVAWFSLLESLQANPGTKRLWIFPILMILWVNLHGSFLFGFALLGIYGSANILSYILDRTSERESHKIRIALLLKIGLLSLIALFVNPYGFPLLIFPFEILGSTEALNSIGEWQSPNFHEFTYYEFYLLLLLATALIARQKIGLVGVFITLFITHASLVGQRFIPLFAVLAAPFVGRQIDALYSDAVSKPAQNWFVNAIQIRVRKSVENLQSFNEGLKHYRLTLALFLAAFAIACNNGALFGLKILDFQFKGPNYPIAAVKFLERNPLPGKMFNFYSYGGYLIYRFYPDPRFRVFVDGRAIVDGENYFTEYKRVNLATHYWKEILKVYHVNWIIYPAGSWLSTLMLEGTDWKLIYADRMANIFIKNIPQNQALIDQFPDVEPAH